MKTAAHPTHWVRVALVCAGIVTSLVVSGPAFAQAGPAPAPDPSHDADRNNSSMSAARGDRRFFEQATESGLKGIAVSEAVMPQLVDPQVRAFAQRMVTELVRITKELRSLGSRKGVSMPMADPRNYASDWSSKGKDADVDYLDEMVGDREDAISLFEGAAKSEDRDVAAFAQQILPQLRDYLAQAKDLQAKRG